MTQNKPRYKKLFLELQDKVCASQTLTTEIFPEITTTSRPMPTSAEIKKPKSRWEYTKNYIRAIWWAFTNVQSLTITAIFAGILWALQFPVWLAIGYGLGVAILAVWQSNKINSLGRTEHKETSLFFSDNLRDTIQTHIVNKIKKAELYSRLHIPMRYGVILYGPPGGGKTSALSYAKQQVNNLENVLVVHFDPTDHPEGLKNTLSTHKDKVKLIIIEDADTSYGARKDGMGTEYLGKMLNIMDGTSDYGATIFCFTTNYLNNLDPALLRPGRIDTQIEIPLIADDIIKLKIARAQLPSVEFSDTDLLANVVGEVSPAEIVSKLRLAASRAIERGNHTDTIVLVEAPDFTDRIEQKWEKRPRIGF